MTTFVDEHQKDHGVEPVLRRVADRPIYLLGAQTPGAGTRPPNRPAAAATRSYGRRSVGCGSRTTAFTEPATYGANWGGKE